MKQRTLAGAAAIGVAAVVVVVALVAGGGGGGGPRALPVLGIAGGAAADEAATMSSPVGGGGGPGYELTGDASGLASEADAWSVGVADGEARAEALAEALGAGELTETGGQWTAEGPDGVLTIDRQPGLPWYYSAIFEDAGVAVGRDTPVSSDSRTSSCSDGTAGDASSCEPPACDTGIEPAGCAEPGSTGDASFGCPDGTASCPPGPDDTCAAPTVTCAPGEAPAGGATCSNGDPGCPRAPPTSSEAQGIDCAMPECPPGAACTQVCPEPGPGGSVEPMPRPEPERPADLPSADEAEAIARELLGAAGADLDGARTRTDDAFSSWVFVADPVIGGLPTFGMTTAVGVGSGGIIEFANGWLADPSEGDTYGLVDVAVALDRLEESGGWFAYAPSSPADCPDCEDLPEPEPTELDSVEVGLQLVPVDGAEEAWLVPSYLFTIAGGGPGAIVAAFAVADEHLVEPTVDPVLVDPLPVEPAPAPVPEPGPGPAPSQGASECAEVAGTGEVPLVATLCASDGAPGVSEDVLVTVSASDGDADVRNDCGSPIVTFDDGGDVAVCDIGCEPPKGPLEGGGLLERTESVVWSSPGEHVITATVESGCGSEWGEQLEVSLTVVVG